MSGPVPDDEPCRRAPGGGWHCVPWKPCAREGGCLLPDDEVPVTPADDARVPSRVQARDEPCADPARCDVHRGADPVADRRQRAREAGHDHLTDYDAAPGIEAAIETATRVKVTPEITKAARAVNPWIMQGEAREVVAAAFRAAGFEVEE